jgi:hypothetical protein
MDLETKLTVCYVMNKMAGLLQGDLRAANLAAAVVGALASSAED